MKVEFLLILLGICWASVVWCLSSILFISVNILHASFSLWLLLELWLSKCETLSVLLASLSTFPVSISSSLCAASWNISSRLLLHSLSFQLVSNLLLELFIGIFISITFTYLKVLFSSPSNVIGNSLYFLVHYMCFQVSFVSLHMVIIVSILYPIHAMSLLCVYFCFLLSGVFFPDDSHSRYLVSLCK